MTTCSYCGEQRAARCSYSDCTFDQDQCGEITASQAAEIEKLRRERDEARAELAAVEEDRDRIRRERGMYCSALQRTEAERDALAADKARLEREKQDLDAIASSHALSLTVELNRRRSAEAREAGLREAFRNADEMDWEWLYRRIDNAGHGRFWVAVFDEFRHALAAKERDTASGGEHG